MGKLAKASGGSSQLEFLSHEEHVGALSHSVAHYFQSALD